MEDKDLYISKVYKDHYNYIYRLCCHYLQYNTHDAEDITEDVFTIFVNSIKVKGDIIPNEKVRAWLISAAVNTLRNNSRKRSKYGNVADINDYADILPEPGADDLEEKIYERLNKENIDLKIISELSDSERELLTYLNDDNLDYTDIGNKLGIKRSAVAMRSLRLYNKVKKMVKAIIETYTNTLVTICLLAFYKILALYF